MPRKDFVEELECELKPLSTQAAGPANISLTVTNMPRGKHFWVDGTSMLQGFSFLVRPSCLVCALGQLGSTGREGLGVEGLLLQVSHLHTLLGASAESSTTPIWPKGRGHLPHP